MRIHVAKPKTKSKLKGPLEKAVGLTISAAVFFAFAEDREMLEEIDYLHTKKTHTKKTSVYPKAEIQKTCFLTQNRERGWVVVVVVVLRYHPQIKLKFNKHAIDSVGATIIVIICLSVVYTCPRQ